MKKSAVDKICSALLKLLEIKPYESITVSDLVKQAGVNRSSYYYHFYSMDDVLEQVIRDFDGHVVSLFHGVTCDGITFGEFSPEVTGRASDVYAYFYERNRDIRALYKAGFALQFRNGLISALEKFFHTVEFLCDGPGGGPEPVDERYRQLIAKELAFYSVATFEFWIDSGFQNTPQEFTEYCAQCTRLFYKISRYKLQ